MRKFVNLFVAAAALAVYASGAAAQSAATRPTAKIGDRAPKLSGVWVQGQAVNFDPGSVTVLVFWEYSRQPSREIFPLVAQLHQRYKDRDVTFAAVANGQRAETEVFVKQRPNIIPYPVMVDTSLSTFNAYMKAFGVVMIPYVFIVDSDSRFFWHGHPAHIGQNIDQAVTKRDTDYVKRAAPGGRTEWVRRAAAAANPAAGAPDTTWQHPLFPWNSTILNNPNLSGFLATATLDTDALGRVTATGAGEEFGEYKLVMFRDVIVSIEKTFSTIGDNPDFNLTPLQDALVAGGFGWRKTGMNMGYPPGTDGGPAPQHNTMLRSSLTQENNGVAITLTGVWEVMTRRFGHAVIKYEHVARRDALRQIENDAKPKAPAIKL